MKNNKSHIASLLLAALFAAVTTICSWINIPLPFTPVPINLATLAMLLTGGLLGPKYGTISMTVYVILGAIGAPVFHGFTGGLGIIAGPTGGYIIGYIAGALVCGIIVKYLWKKGFLMLLAALILGTFACYLFGTAWFIVSTGSGLIAALLMCVVPFLIGDGIKIVIAFFLIKKLKPILSKGEY